MFVNQYARFSFLLALLAATWLTYRPGLAGGFLFDDFANLPSLGATGPINNAAALARYVTSGTADPLGRPISVASFLLDAQDWPTTAYPFKRTNLLIHLTNGLLLYLVLLAMGRESLPEAPTVRITAAAWIGTALWLLHPLFVSTTLYIVQREAMLPATFSLLGILAWIKARESFRGNRIASALAYVVLCLAVCTTLASLSKANGVLLPTLILAIEYTAFSPRTLHLSAEALHVRNLALTSAWLLTAIILLALAYVAATSMIYGLPHRPWTEIQRLLTEPRILWQYLGSLWLPRPYTAGIFNDAITVSKDMLHPWTTLPSVLSLAAVVGGAAFWRRRYPFVACALLFFFVGHLLESTSIPLELFFEHRNYLPALLMFWPIGLWCSGATRRSGQPVLPPSLAIRYVVVLLIVLSLGVMTRTNANLWGDTSVQFSLWARLNPNSPRAQVGAAQEELASGAPQKAVARLSEMLERHPAEVQIAFNLVAAHCALGDLQPNHLLAARDAIAAAIDPGALILSWFERTIPVAIEGTCARLDLPALAGLARAGLENPRLNAGRRQDLEHVLGSIALATKKPEEALIHFNRALALDPKIPVALRQAAELGSSGRPDLGLSHLATFDTLYSGTESSGLGMPAVHSWILRHQGYWEHEREGLETTLRTDKAARR